MSLTPAAAQLASRFQREVFKKGFIAEDNLPTTLSEKITKDVKTVFAASREILIPVLETIPPIETISDAVLELKKRRSNFLESLEISKKVSKKYAQETIVSCCEGERSVLENMLLFSSRFSAGSVFLQRMEIAWDNLHQALCRTFFAKTAAVYLQNEIGKQFAVTKILSNLPLSPFNPLTTVRDMLTRMEKAPETMVTRQKISQLCISTFLAAEAHFRVSTSIEKCSEIVLDSWVKTVQSLEVLLQENLVEIKNCVIPEKKSWFQKLFAKNEDSSEIESKLAHLQQKRRELEESMTWANTFIQGWVEKVLAPYLARDYILQAVQNEHVVLKERLENFCKKIENYLESSPYQETIENQEWAEKSYHEIVSTKTWEEFTDEILAFDSATMVCDQETLRCRYLETLKEYFQENPRSLANRISAYSLSLFAEVANT